ncbi:MAG: aminotransferase class V-fold PLP-dependent enzyme [Cytophagia bacterium]|nr:aminotransferase class V-fold PLP-dependent enzyme [Cytophagia bacterium]
MDKRTFLKNLMGASLATTPFYREIQKLSEHYAWQSDYEFAQNDDFWAKIRKDYLLKPEYINLENGYYCMLPQPTLERYLERIREVNYQASYYMRTVQSENKAKSVNALAELAHCSNEELIITRNTTESLDTIIQGFPWQKGDEAVMSNQDYDAMLNMFKQVEARQGIALKTIDVPMDPSSDEVIVEAYRKAITPKTKLLMVCHLINITGHILPIRKICDMAHGMGVEVMVDGAHAFGQIDFNMKELDCDYYGTSLHKWLSVPLGAGFLYVKKDKVDKTWPLIAEGPTKPGDIKRLNHTGTHPVATDLTIMDAIDYHKVIGIERKEARLRFLQNYWVDKVREIENVVINTPTDKARSCAIANVGIRGMKPSDMSKQLLEDYNIWTVAIDGAGVHGCRITPNVYTTTQELDKFVKALKDMA